MYKNKAVERWHKKNAERIKNKKHEWYVKNRDKARKISKDWFENNKEKVKARSKKYYSEKKENILAYGKKYRQKNKEYFRLRSKVYRENNKEHCNAVLMEWQNKNKTVYNRMHSNAQKAYMLRNRCNPKFTIDSACRKALSLKLKGKSNWGKIFDNRFGYTHEEFAKHMINQFDEKMSIGNYGKYWEVDHIKPVSQFDYTSYDDKEFKECWSLKNLRPLEKSLNRKKINTKKI